MIGTIFKCVRISQDKKTKELAEILGRSLAYVCDVENGRKSMGINMLREFSKAYQVPLSKIMEWEEKAREENLTFPEILVLCASYEAEKLKQQQESLSID